MLKNCLTKVVNVYIKTKLFRNANIEGLQARSEKYQIVNKSI